MKHKVTDYGCESKLIGAEHSLLSAGDICGIVLHNKEVSTNNCCEIKAFFLIFRGYCRNILHEPSREPCNQKEIAAVLFRQFIRRVYGG